LVGVELSNCLEQSLVADGDELTQVESMPLVFLDVGDDEPKVRRDETLGSFLVSALRAAGQSPLFFGVLYQWELLYVLQVLIEGGRGRTPKIPLGPALGRLLHTRSFTE
jgi:hypothetical protein